MFIDRGADKFYNPATENIETPCLDISPWELKACHDAFGIPTDKLIPKPDVAPKTIDFGSFWTRTIPLDFGLSATHEDFLGLEYDGQSGLEVEERTKGSAQSVQSESLYLINLHTEPIWKPESQEKWGIKPIHRELTSIPSGHAGDAGLFIQYKNAYVCIIVGYHPEFSPVLFLLKTGSTKLPGRFYQWSEIIRFVTTVGESFVKATLDIDKKLTKDLGLAVYRGFTPIPPIGEVFLRKRA